jgi:hypothetical protein
LSIILPKGGSDSSLLFFWAIKYVTFDLLVESDKGCFNSFAFSFPLHSQPSTCHYIHPRFPSNFNASPLFYTSMPLAWVFFASTLETLAKDEKYLALLLSSPLRNAYIFISLGSSVKENLTFSCLPMWEHVISLSSIFRKPAKSILINLWTTIQLSLQFCPKSR